MEKEERKGEEMDRLLLLKSLAFEERRKRVGYGGKDNQNTIIFAAGWW